MASVFFPALRWQLVAPGYPANPRCPTRARHGLKARPSCLRLARTAEKRTSKAFCGSMLNHATLLRRCRNTLMQFEWA